jgi:hypothetical protein
MNYILCLFANNTGSIIVGIFTLIGAILGVFLANYYNRKAENNRSKMEIKAFLQAIYIELNILWRVYAENEDSIGRFLENGVIVQMREFIIPAPEIYFIIYKSNANLLGKIENKELGRLIVSVYLHINEMGNSFNTYVNLLKILPADNMKSYLEKIKQAHAGLKEEWGKFRKIIEKELKI